MASGDTNVTIVNQALVLLGSDTISSFSDTTNDAATVANNIYETIKGKTLSLYPWSFALVKEQLARSTATPVNEWTYLYPLPSTAVSGTALQVYNSSSTRVLPIQNYELLYTSSGPAIATNEDNIYIDYVSSVVSEGLMPKYFVQLLVYMLAWHLAEPVTDQITKAEYWRGVALGSLTENGRGGYFRQACNIDGRGKPNYAIVDFPLTDVR
jgi:hypothetical protein|tara:strand:- start:260 stop:892 length:633 start_codon:yes stop_codon:yes gene_type:complete